MAEPTLPPLPAISSPKSGDRLQATISQGSEMAEAQALWQLRARAQQVRARQQQAQAPRRAPPSRFFPLSRAAIRRATVWKKIKVIYAAGALVYFIGGVVVAFRIPYFSDWLLYVVFQALYALIWPIVIL